MSRYFTSKLRELKPYVPGEQPQDQKYIKLNTNESPFPPSPKALIRAQNAVDTLMLYPDPNYQKLRTKLAEMYGVSANQIIVGNGSDEILNFAFSAFGEPGVVFPDITYGFYPVSAHLNSISYQEIPLDTSLRINPNDYCNIHKTIVLANPNALSGIALSCADIEMIVKSNPDNVVIIDEAYVDFGGESAVNLISKYDNLLIIQTFSKSRSFAGARIGFGIGSFDIINDLNTIRCSINPYNISRITAEAALGVLDDESYTRKNCATIIKTRNHVTEKLRNLGFIIPESSANFIFAKHPKLNGDKIYHTLKERGILVRHFDNPKISAYIRITIGSSDQMERLITEIEQILSETKI